MSSVTKIATRQLAFNEAAQSDGFDLSRERMIPARSAWLREVPNQGGEAVFEYPTQANGRDVAYWRSTFDRVSLLATSDNPGQWQYAGVVPFFQGYLSEEDSRFNKDYFHSEHGRMELRIAYDTSAGVAWRLAERSEKIPDQSLQHLVTDRERLFRERHAELTNFWSEAVSAVTGFVTDSTKLGVVLDTSILDTVRLKIAKAQLLVLDPLLDGRHGYWMMNDVNLDNNPAAFHQPLHVVLISAFPNVTSEFETQRHALIHELFHVVSGSELLGRDSSNRVLSTPRSGLDFEEAVAGSIMLNEGLTELLARRVSPPFGRAAPAYEREVVIVQRLINIVGLQPFLDAYFTDSKQDMRDPQTKLGKLYATIGERCGNGVANLLMSQFRPNYAEFIDADKQPKYRPYNEILGELEVALGIRQKRVDNVSSLTRWGKLKEWVRWLFGR